MKKSMYRTAFVCATMFISACASNKYYLDVGVIPCDIPVPTKSGVVNKKLKKNTAKYAKACKKDEGERCSGDWLRNVDKYSHLPTEALPGLRKAQLQGCAALKKQEKGCLSNFLQFI